ncbi:MAG TPA: response regulator [Nitrososphaera sp.]|nr:response regulator [Nitrososphaera sp.]
MNQKQPLKVLLVDDEEDIVYVLKKGLELNGFKIDSFTDPVRAVQQFQPDYYDAVIIDIKMPMMSGLDLYEKIREKDAAVRVYLMSAYDTYEKEVKEKFAANELVKFVKKPTTYAVLAEMLKKDSESKRLTSFIF